MFWLFVYKSGSIINMAERKVLIKYFPKNFDHDRIVKRGRGKDKLMMVRNMLPMSLRCNTCQNYLYIGTKFNMRMEICNEETYLGIKVFRFYFKCTYCYAELTFKTDPKNHDYVVEAGATRNYEAIKDAQHAEKYLKRLKVNEKEENSMKYLENKSYDSKREMELMEALEDIKNLNKRQAIIDPEDLLKNLIYEEEEEDKFDEEQEVEIDQKFNQLKEQMLSGQEARVFGSVLLQSKEPVKTENIETNEVKKEEAEEREGKEEKEVEKEVEKEGEAEEKEGGNEGLKRKPEVSASQLSVPFVKKFLVNNCSGQQKKVQVKSLIGSMKKKITKPNPKTIDQQS